jgi:hypothetical protein
LNIETMKVSSSAVISRSATIFDVSCGSPEVQWARGIAAQLTAPRVIHQQLLPHQTRPAPPRRRLGGYNPSGFVLVHQEGP